VLCFGEIVFLLTARSTLVGKKDRSEQVVPRVSSPLLPILENAPNLGYFCIAGQNEAAGAAVAALLAYE
jgi:hypothetical protein